SKAATVSFEPPDGRLYVGSKDVITCVVKDNPTQDNPGTFALTADPDNPSLLSLDNKKAQIKPPADSGVYTTAGNTSVTCRWTGAPDALVLLGSFLCGFEVLEDASKAATVSFEPPDGRLYVGSKDVITCVVKDNPTQDNPGTFALTADPDNPSLLSLDNTKAQIKPPADSGVYTTAGNTSVTCRWTGAPDASAENTLRVEVLRELRYVSFSL
ncbi:hypothetical protein T265_15243, partial [Opisthorchis viverrini]